MFVNVIEQPKVMTITDKEGRGEGGRSNIFSGTVEKIYFIKTHFVF